MGRSALDVYCKEISTYPLLTPQKEQELAKDGSAKAREILVVSNLRLVVKLAKDVGSSNMLPDLIAEGNTGLIEAANRFEDRGIRFTTYARWWILQRISKYISSNCSAVRVPQQFRIKAAKYKAMAGQTDEEVKESFQCGKRGLQNLKAFKIGSDTTLEDLKGLPDDQTSSYSEELRKYVQTVISEELEDQEQDILYRHLGLFGVEKETLKELGTSLKLSPERVRQIEEAAIRKLRTRIVLADNLTPAILQGYR